ncbi:hypothetical protein Tco_0327672 [Tanacetum coccineum]
MVGSSIYTVTSVLTQRELDLHCATFNIPAELRPELPDRNSRIKDSPEGKIGMYTRFMEFTNYRILLSKFLLCVLEYYQINLSQLSVIGAAKVSHFEIMCRALGRIPIVDASVCPLSISRFGVTFVVKDPLSVDEAVDLPCVELLNENCTLIRKYPEIFLCFVGLSRSFVETDVRPTLLRDIDEEMGLLDFVKSADPFKVKVGERTLAENEVSLITETKDKVISSSLQIISLVDHTIQDELNVNSDKRKKRVAFVSGSSPVKKAQTKGIGEQAAVGSGSAAPATKDATSSFVTPTSKHALEDVLYDNVRTRPPTGRFVVLSSSSADTDIHAASQVVLLVSSSQAGVSVPTAESVGDGYPLPAPEFETGTLSATPSHGSSANDFYESQTVDSATAMNVYVPNWNVTNNARVDDHVICRSLLDNVTPPGYWDALRNQSDVGFLNSFNINSAQHICMASELCLHYEHEIMTREKFERKFTNSVAVVQQREAEVVELKVKLEKSESEVAEVEEIRKRVSDLEAMVAVKVGEVASLTTQNASLLEKVSIVELERDSLKSQVMGEGKMREEFVSQQDAVEQCFTEHAVKLDARIADVRRDMDNDRYPHMLTAIAGRRWVIRHGFRLAVYKCARSVECRSAMGKVISMAIIKGIQQGLEAGVVHGKAGRSLAQIEAYDPEVKEKYVATVSKFESVSFLLLDELESLKDSPLTLIMSALVLKDDHGITDAAPGFAPFQPSLDQIFVPIYSKSGYVDREMLLADAIPAICQSTERRGLCPPSRSTLGEASGSAPPHDSSLGVVDYQVSTLVLAGDGGSAKQAPTIQPYDDLFDTFVLDKPSDA